jgi:aquaporin Z
VRVRSFAGAPVVGAASRVFYVAAQFAGGAAGVALAGVVLGPPLGHAAANFVVTRPGIWRMAPAFLGEVAISMGLMLAVLTVSNTRRLAGYTPLVAAALVAVYIAVEAPVSGMSMNPARTLGSAPSAREWKALWIYFSAPPLGMPSCTTTTASAASSSATNQRFSRARRASPGRGRS